MWTTHITIQLKFMKTNIAKTAIFLQYLFVVIVQCMIGLQNITDHGIGGCIVQIKLVLIIMEKVCFKIHQNGHTMDRPKCKECNGTGDVVFTKERGGPVCNNCGGNGYLTDLIIQRRMASIMDSPSLYMDGPSHGNMKKAEKIIQFLKEEGLL